MVFTQKVKVTDFSQPIKGYLEFMTCDDEKCLPPTEVDFSFTLTPATTASPSPAAPAKPDAGGEKAATAAKTPSASTAPQANSNLISTTTASTDTATEPMASIQVIEAKTADGNIQQPVRWQLDVRQLDANEYEVVFTALLEKGWNLYSQFTEDNGPIPTTFLLKNGDTETPWKMAEKGDLKEGEDPVFGVVVKKFEHGPVTFTAKVNGQQNLNGLIDYMSCDDASCIPLRTPFEISFQPLAAKVGEESAPSSPTEPDAGDDVIFGGLRKSVVDQAPTGQCGGEEVVTGKGIWQIFGLGFLGGLIALLTPCVFPMIPLTVSFFTKSATSRKKGVSNAVLYGFFIFLVYLLLSIPFHLMDSIDPDILNKISTDVTLNVIFFGVFIIFAISFFGYFELTLPKAVQ
ncbi:MAG: cytochrome c biogenesis protein CcdA [Saprospiraceae bacterium]